MDSQRLYSLDFLKFVAALMITNSHFQPLYEDVSPSLATFGVHGNALFFFVSGYLLMIGFMRKKELGFVDWYKKRMRRLWPSVFIWTIVSAAIWGMTLTVEKLVLFDGYWFLQAIVICYIVYYLIGRCESSLWGGKLRPMCLVFTASFLLTMICFFLMPKAEGSPFHTSLHFICHFSIMVMGGICYLTRDKLCCNKCWRDVLWMLLSFVLYFLILKVGKGQDGIRYYVQIFALIPLHTFVYYLYKVSSYPWCNYCFHKKFLGRTLSVIASLTLEIYIVQFAFITDSLNRLFPLNVVIVFGIIVLAAYILKVLTSLFLAVMSTEHLVWSEIVKI